MDELKRLLYELDNAYTTEIAVIKTEAIEKLFSAQAAEIDRLNKIIENLTSLENRRQKEARS